MANEAAPHAEWQRLYERYHAMSDGELLGLAGDIDDLTEIAADVLRQEMQGRRMEVENPAPVASFSPPDGPGWWNPVASKTQTGKSPLITFHDAMEASRAGDFRDAHEIGFEMKDYSSLNPMGRQVSLQLIVNGSDRERAMEVLREAVGLFPLQEVEVPDAPVDDGAVSTLGDFAQREDAEKSHAS
jgi:hypothetical protein